MELTKARTAAETLVEILRPACERVEIAGSIRREKPDVGDVEIVAMPILKPPRPVFGERKIFKTQLDRVLFQLEVTRRLDRIKGGDKYKQYWVLANGGIHAIKLDLFLVTPPAQWGVIDLIRTGPEDFSHWMVTPRSKGGALPDGFIVRDGAVWEPSIADVPIGGMTMLYMPEERNIFTLYGMDWIEPRDREARWGAFAGITDQDAAH